MTWYATSADSSDKKDESRKIRIETSNIALSGSIFPIHKKDESRKIRIETQEKNDLSLTLTG